MGVCMGVCDVGCYSEGNMRPCVFLHIRVIYACMSELFLALYIHASYLCDRGVGLGYACRGRLYALYFIFRGAWMGHVI